MLTAVDAQEMKKTENCEKKIPYMYNHASIHAYA